MKSTPTLLRIMHRYIHKHSKKVKFVVVGAACFLINSLVLLILHRLVGWPVFIAQILGYEAGLIFGFFMNRKWTYAKNDKISTFSAFSKYHWASLSALILSTSIVVILSKHLGLDPNLALVFASGIAMIWNYFLYDRFVFRKDSEKPKVKLIKKILLYFIAWEILLTAIGFGTSLITHVTIGDQWSKASPTIIENTYRWDAEWFARITDANWYHTNAQSAVFYPSFPLAIKAVENTFVVDAVTAAFIVNIIAAAFAFCYLGLLAFELLRQDSSKAFRVVILFSAFPAAFFLHAMYSEALLCALGFSAFYYALRRRWLLSCVLLIFCLLTRLPAVFFALACFIEYFRSIDYNIRRIRPQIGYFALVPLGVVIYSYYLYRIYGSPTYIIQAYHAGSQWTYHRFSLNIPKTMYDTGIDGLKAIHHRGKAWFPYALWQLPSLAFWTASIFVLLYGWVRKMISAPLITLVLVSCIFFALNSNFVSVIRYLLPLFPLYIILVAACRKKYTFPLLVSLLSGIEIWFFILFVMHYFVA